MIITIARVTKTNTMTRITTINIVMVEVVMS